MIKNYPAFRNLLRGAICNRTQAQFANESGISAEHLRISTRRRPRSGLSSRRPSGSRNAQRSLTVRHPIRTRPGSMP